MISDRFINDGKPSLKLSELQRKHIAIFQDKCRSGEYMFVKRKCECGSMDCEIIAQKDRYGIAVDTVICKNCGLIRTSPFLDDGSNKRFYVEDYPFIYRAEVKPSEEKFFQERSTADIIVQFIRKHTNILQGDVLEIGCADGRNVIAFAEKGYNVVGIDLSSAYVEFGRRRGLNLFCCDASEYKERGQKFDIIVLNHVLEHFTDLERELGTIKGLLKQEGRLYIGVPGVRALSFGAYHGDFLLMLQNAHVYNFTRDTLCRVMRKYGFDTVFCNEGVYGIFKSGKSEEINGNSYLETMNYLREVELAAGDKEILLQNRLNEILGRYGTKEVLLYGTALELDAFVQKITELVPIKGFFYSDQKSPAEIAEYVCSVTDVKCILVMDAEHNAQIMDELAMLLSNCECDIFSVYTDLF
ncbi:MAG: class I SAM-dependent methyltransferase [Lachnospiraceae bacterium]|nr:class I SAM-dependent methyltransferase [Lachnospiraceae bacterium]